MKSIFPNATKKSLHLIMKHSLTVHGFFGFSKQNGISNLSFTFIFCQHVAHIFSAFWQNMKVKVNLQTLFFFKKPKNPLAAIGQ